MPFLEKLEVLDTDGYFVMQRSAINANYSKVTHYPMYISTIMQIAPNLQELSCDCIPLSSFSFLVSPLNKCSPSGNRLY